METVVGYRGELVGKVEMQRRQSLLLKVAIAIGIVGVLDSIFRGCYAAQLMLPLGNWAEIAPLKGWLHWRWGTSGGRFLVPCGELLLGAGAAMASWRAERYRQWLVWGAGAMIGFVLADGILRMATVTQESFGGAWTAMVAWTVMMVTGAVQLCASMQMLLLPLLLMMWNAGEWAGRMMERPRLMVRLVSTWILTVAVMMLAVMLRDGGRGLVGDVIGAMAELQWTAARVMWTWAAFYACDVVCLAGRPVGWALLALGAAGSMLFWRIGRWLLLAAACLLVFVGVVEFLSKGVEYWYDRAGWPDSFLGEEWWRDCLLSRADWLCTDVPMVICAWAVMRFPEVKACFNPRRDYVAD
jgi:hypothetical protein